MIIRVTVGVLTLADLSCAEAPTKAGSWSPEPLCDKDYRRGSAQNSLRDGRHEGHVESVGEVTAYFGNP